MHKPQNKFGKDFVFEETLFLEIAKSIKKIQLKSGAIPSNKDNSHDPWDHIESIMGLNFLQDKESADLAFDWLKNNQNADGSWYSKYLDEKPIELNKPTHYSPYISVAALHHYKIFSDKKKLSELWKTISLALDFSINLQNPNGTIPWSVDKNNKIEEDFLITGSSSILKSIECAIKISRILEEGDNNSWIRAYKSLAMAIKNPKGLFDVTMDRSRFSMDWYYPIISGALSSEEKDFYIKKILKDFYVDGLGIKCVIEEPWVTVAETSEFIITLVISNRLEEARKIFFEVMNITDENDVPYMGWQYEQNIFWPEEKPSWTSAALILAADSIYNFSSGSDILTVNHL